MRIYPARVTYAAPAPPVEPPPEPTEPSSAAARMLEMLPDYYQGSSVMQAILESQGAEVDLVRAAIDGGNGILDQWFVRTATWGLDRWEAELGLPFDATLSESERQDRIVSHLRGYGTATIALVKSVAEAFVFGVVDVDDEGTDPTLPDYHVRVTFIDEHGIPSNIADVQSAIREIVPAHLEILWEFNWTLWSEVDAQAWTWGQIDGTTPGGPAGAPLTWAEWDQLL